MFIEYTQQMAKVLHIALIEQVLINSEFVSHQGSNLCNRSSALFINNKKKNIRQQAIVFWLENSFRSPSTTS